MKAHNRTDLTGHRIGKLVVIEPVKNPAFPKRLYWKCKCDCGVEKIINASVLKRPKTKSCGCERIATLRKKMWQGYNEISLSYWSRLKDGAKERNLPFEITIESVWDLYLTQNRSCALSGEPIFFARSIRHKAQTASLDRIDNEKGYVAGNVMWVHKAVNKLKATFDVKELVHWCHLISENSGIS